MNAKKGCFTERRALAVLLTCRDPTSGSIALGNPLDGRSLCPEPEALLPTPPCTWSTRTGGGSHTRFSGPWGHTEAPLRADAPGADPG